MCKGQSVELDRKRFRKRFSREKAGKRGRKSVGFGLFRFAGRPLTPLTGVQIPLGTPLKSVAASTCNCRGLLRLLIFPSLDSHPFFAQLFLSLVQSPCLRSAGRGFLRFTSPVPPIRQNQGAVMSADAGLTLPKTIASSRELSPGAKLVYSALCYFASSTGENQCSPEQVELSSCVGQSRRSIQNHLRDLSAAGLISITPRQKLRTAA